MGRLELLIPFTEVVVIEEDRRRGVLRVVVEGEEYPRWQLGYEVMAMRIDIGSSLVGMGQMLEQIEDARMKLAELLALKQAKTKEQELDG